MQPVPDWGTVPRMLRAQAASSPDAVVVADGPVRLTVADLRTAAREMALGLIGLGIAPRERVAIWAPNTWQWAVSAFGAWDAGAVVVPLSTRYKGFEAGQILAKTGARVLVASSSFLGTEYIKLLDTEFGPASDELPFAGLPELRHVIVLDGSESRPGCYSLEAVHARGAAVDEQVVEERARAVRPDDVVEILATSGTTGEPKGVMLTGDQVMRAYWDWSEINDLRAGDRYPIVSPFAHGFGINAGMIACVMRCAEMHPIALFDADSALELIERERLTLLAGPPALFEGLLSRPDLPERDISSLRVAVVGAAAVPTELIRRMQIDPRLRAGGQCLRPHRRFLRHGDSGRGPDRRGRDDRWATRSRNGGAHRRRLPGSTLPPGESGGDSGPWVRRHGRLLAGAGAHLAGHR